MKMIMKRWKRSAAVLGAALCLGAQHAEAAILGPYSADANTTYLYHFNEPVNSTAAVNSGSAGYAAVAYNGAPYAGDGVDQPTVATSFGGAAYSGFGSSGNLTASANVGFGVDVSGNGAFQLGDDTPISNDQLANHNTVFGAGNAFTLEAMVNVPAIATTGVFRHIISSDNSLGATDRGFQFRINQTGQLEFNFVGAVTSAVTATIPVAGPNAFAANEWFHVALSHDGTNARFYWTRVDPSVTTANLIGGPVAEGVDINDDALIVIGNEGRNFGSGANSTESLRGLIDEVRISNVARGADQMLFGVPEPSTAVMALAALAFGGFRRRR